MDNWKEYNDGKLQAPAILQHDILGKEHLIWGLAKCGIVGPLSRSEYNEEALLSFFGDYDLPTDNQPAPPIEPKETGPVIPVASVKIISEDKGKGTIIIEIPRGYYEKATQTTAMSAEVKP